jgi:cleavage stimulation factor subunit 2
MWGGGAVPPPPMPQYGAAQAATTQSQQKHDIFVGNLAFNTTEDQLHQAFSEIGRVLKVRLVTDAETGKPRGFAFIEFEDPQAALSAIRNMNDYELNGRRIRVNFSNSSHLEALAGKLGMDLSSRDNQPSSSATAGQGRGAIGAGPSGTQSVSDALKGFSKSEAYDVVAKLKEIADRDPDEARRLLSGHPQLPEAILFLMASRLDMITTPLPTEAPPVVPTATTAPPVPAAPPRVDPRQRAADPRAAAVPPPVVPQPPPAMAAVDPRQRMAQQQQQSQQHQMVQPQQYGGMPQPVPMQQQQQQQLPMMGQPSAAIANLDPSLVQQVMSLTPQQIAQLPPDKQQSILALRQQITGTR